MKTTYTKAPEVSRKWRVIDAKGQPLGRIAAVAARILQGKHKPTFTPHIDDGDFVVITNAYQFILTGRKENTKVYKHHTGYIGGLKEVNHKLMMQKKPWFPIEKAVKAMLPKNRLARQMFKKLIIVEESEFKNANGGLIIHQKI
ncbi:MAG: 50S ribosomal protein L13 [Brevinemataceae bacterium]